MTRSPASKSAKAKGRSMAANAPRPPSVKDVEQTVKKAGDAVAETARKAEASAEKTVRSAQEAVSDTAKKAEAAAENGLKKAESALNDAGRKVDTATDSILETVGVKDFPKVPSTEPEKRRTMLIIYVLYFLSIFTFGLTGLFAYVFYVRKLRNDMKSAVWESHMVWLERSFLISACAFVVGVILMLFGGFGKFVMFLSLIYLLYCTVKGFLSYDDSKAIKDPKALY